MNDHKYSILLVVLTCILLVCGSTAHAQAFEWRTTADTLYRDGVPCFLKGQSWAKKTVFTYQRDEAAEQDVKQVLTELHEIGVNTIRIYGSPNDSDWDGSANFHNLIRWIEEWNVENPDEGDPKSAMYYMVQLSPADPQSPISSDLPENSEAAFDRAINDPTNPESVASLVQQVDDLTEGSKYLMGYLIYHELNVSSKYDEWRDAIGLQGIEDFMNAVADSLHNRYAPGKLVAHTGDAKDDEDDIYQGIESLDQVKGNVFENFDMLGFNLYISSDALITKNRYYDRIVNRRALSVNETRGWFIGETGPSFDKSASSSAVAAANYTNPEGGANLQLMFVKSAELGNMIGYMLFTVQDNDLGAQVGDDIKQRGYYDVYGDKKFLYYIYPDVLNSISSNHRKRLTSSYLMELTIDDVGDTYRITYRFENYSDSDNRTLEYNIHADDGSGGSQRFGETICAEYVTLAPCEAIEIVKTVSIPSSKFVVASASLIREFAPENPYLWGREHLLEDAICTVAGLNLFLNTQQEVPEITLSCQALPADLGVQWSSQASEIFLGDTLTISLEVSNSGPSDATELEVGMSIGTGFSILETSNTEGSLSDDFSKWTIGSLAKNDLAQMQFSVKILETGEYAFTASTEGYQEDSFDSNNESTLEIQPQQVLGNSFILDQSKEHRGKLVFGVDQYLQIPAGSWTLKIYDLSGTQLLMTSISEAQQINLKIYTNGLKGVGIFMLEPHYGPVRSLNNFSNN
ncbi:MAG: DUF11 domain-containing protein [Cyclobacteriaceae bacterium]